MASFSVLVIDDVRAVRELIGKLLRNEGYRVLSAESCGQGLHFLQYDSVDLLITDLRLPGDGGLEVLKQARRLRPGIPVILVTGYGSVESAVDAMRGGACDYVTKPITRQKLLDAVNRAREALPTGDSSQPIRGGETIPEIESVVIARGRALCDILTLLHRIAPTKAPVLIQGETGVGKNLIAQRIHFLSDRSSSPFVRVDCGAIPDSSFESELFGHEKGAFPEADQRRVGCFELAHGGTIFLDELGELPRRAQARLLHTLQDGRFRRVGGTEILDVDVRVIAATSRDLEEDVQKGRLRRDLYLQVNLVSLLIPPLRERPEDITALVEYFLERFSAQHGKSELRLSADVMNFLLSHTWPGNVRELCNAIERAVILSEGEEIETRHLPDLLRAGTKPPSSGEMITVPLGGNLEDIERHLIHEMITRCAGNKAEAARRLGMHRRTLYRVIGRGDPMPSSPSQSTDSAPGSDTVDCA